MAQVVLIEDRPDRKRRLLDQNDISLDDFKNCMDVFSGNNFEILKNEISDEKYDSVKGSSVIMTHRSAWSQVNLDRIRNLAKEQSSLLVLFSGGISTSYFSSRPVKTLTIDVSEFYGSNLKLFLDKFCHENIIEPLLLQYGERWSLQILMEARNNIAVYLAKHPDIEELSTYNIMEDPNGVQLSASLFSYLENGGKEFQILQHGIKSGASNKLRALMDFVNDQIEEELYFS